MPTTVEKTTRGISPLLLVLAALCFLLPFAAVSCNSSAAGALGSGLSQLGGSASSASPQETACLNDLSNGKDFVTYSGLNLVTGSDPTINSASCDATSTSSSDKGGVGAQPLLIVALVLIGVGILASALRARPRALVAGLASVIAAVLVLVASSTAHGDIISKINSGTTSSLSSLGVGSLDSFFNVHAGIGFWLILVALFLAVLVNLFALLGGSRLRLSASGGSASPPAGAPPGGYPPGPPPGDPTAQPPPPPPPAEPPPAG